MEGRDSGSFGNNEYTGGGGGPGLPWACGGGGREKELRCWSTLYGTHSSQPVN